MTIADLARANAISFECKKDALQQRQSGDWKISFTVQGVDMDERITRAAMGTRYIAVLVEVNDDELPINQPAKGIKTFTAAPEPQPDVPRSAGAKREGTEGYVTRNWKALLPSTQAGIRSHDAVFEAFLRETRPDDWHEARCADDCLKLICGVTSKTELVENQKARALWHQLDEQFLAWKYVDA